MTVLDASVLVAHFDRTDPHHERAGEILLSLGDAPLRASALTLAEVLVGPTRAGLAPEVSRALVALGIEAVPIAQDAAERLAALRVRTGLKLPDCCVLLAAEDVAATELATFDKRLADAAREHGLRLL